MRENFLGIPRNCFVMPRSVYIRENVLEIPRNLPGATRIVYIWENLLVMPKIPLKIHGFHEN